MIKDKLKKVVKKARKEGVETTRVDKLCQKEMPRRMAKIIKDESHPLNEQYVFLRLV